MTKGWTAWTVAVIVYALAGLIAGVLIYERESARQVYGDSVQRIYSDGVRVLVVDGVWCWQKDSRRVCDTKWDAARARKEAGR